MDLLLGVLGAVAVCGAMVLVVSLPDIRRRRLRSGDGATDREVAALKDEVARLRASFDPDEEQREPVGER